MAFGFGTPPPTAVPEGAATVAKFIELGVLRLDGSDAVEVVPCVAGVLSPAGSDAAEVKAGVGFAKALGATVFVEFLMDKLFFVIGACAWFNGFNRSSCWFCAATCDVKSSPVESPKPILK
jgi:hypothetical protein